MAIITILLAFAGCGAEKNGDIGSGGETKLSDLSGKKIGVVTGSIQAIKLPGLIPDATYLEFNTYADLIVAFNAKKVDAFSTDESIYKAMLWEGQSVDRIDEAIDLSDYGMIFEKGADLDLQNKVNSYIAKIKDNGAHKALEEKWFGDSEPTVFETYDDLDGANGTLKIGVSSASKPFVYVKDGKYAGFEVELMIGFCREYGYRLEFEDTAFAAIMAGVASGRYHIGMSGITITDERRESVDFSDVNHTEDLVLVIHKLGNKDESTGIAKLSDLSGKRIGIVTGTLTSVLVPQLVPDAVYVEFNSTADAKMALDNGKIDAFPTDESAYLAMRWEGIAVERVAEAIAPSNSGIIFEKGKNPTLQKQFNDYLAKIKDNGTWQDLQDKWFGNKEPAEFADYHDLSGENGSLRVGICSTTKPFTYLKNGQYAGHDVELIVGFCREYGYSVEFEDTLFAGVLAGVASGTFDMGAAGFTITDERKESVDFSDVSHTEDLVLVVKEQKQSGGNTTHLSDLAGKSVGVLTGSIHAVMMPKLVSDAEYMEFNSITDLIVALNSNKIDAFGCDESLYTSMLWEGQAVDRIDEALGESNYGMIFPKGQKLELQKEVNGYIAKIGADGTLQALEEKWFGAKEPTEFISYDNLNGTKGTIIVAIDSASMPFVYRQNNKFVGFDIEFITGFAQEYGYDIQFEDVVFAAILGGVQSAKYDLGISGITITEERRESMDFSDVYHVEDLAVIIRRGAGAEDLEQFNSATLGVVTGSLYGGYSREQFPNASIKEFNTFADVLVALKQGKVDGIMLDKPNFNSVARTDKSLTSITVPAYSVEIGFGFQKNDAGNALQAQMNAFLTKLKAEGKIDVLIDKWYGETEPSETIPLDELASNAKTLNVAIDTTRKPFVYMYEGKPVGFEIEVLYMFCKEYGYNVNISDISFASGLSGLASEKYDLVCGGLYMTDERKESVNFSDPYMNAEVVMAKCERSGFENFMLSLRDSFEKTFIREQRWKLIVEGICTTMIISVFSVLGGTLLGFALYMLARSKTKWLSKLAKGFAKVYSTIIAGTPTLVVLMILFYIVFTSPDMSGVVVAIIGFILTFGSFVYEQLSLTVSGVDNGQLEAAYALGYSRNQTFFRIVLPQAMKMFLPSYSGEIVSLIKATSVVGYIAVNDLTKMGDIIRGNTYEAFFPLIAVALIYFAITWAVAGLLSVLRRKTEPKKRNNKNILKGVVR